VLPPRGPEAAPLGLRGDRPVLFPTPLAPDQLPHVFAIPGAGWRPGAVAVAWDIAARVGKSLGYTLAGDPLTAPVAAAGLPRYEALGLRDILYAYQKVAVHFLLQRAYGILALPMRTGKCLVALAADIVADSRWTLIVAPSLVKWVWADEIWKWCKQEAIILEGRGGREARQYCGACEARGTLADGTHCPACKQLNGQSYGYRILEVRKVNKPVRAPRIDVPRPRTGKKKHTWRTGPRVRMNLMDTPRTCGPPYPRAIDVAQMRAFREQEYAAADDGKYQCSRHPDVRSDDKAVLCSVCRLELLTALKQARYVISNYDIIAAQDHHDGAGGFTGVRFDLPGWASLLANLQFDIAILDEAHVLRGRPDKMRKGRTRRDRLVHALSKIPRVWLLTGTPIYGYTRDLWSPLDIASAGLFGQPWFEFDSAYCEGHVNAYGGWEAIGRSIRATVELKERLDFLMHKKERSEIVAYLPRKQRQVIRIDPKAALTPIKVTGDRRHDIAQALATTLEHKLEEVVDTVLAELVEGNKTLVFTYLRASAECVYTAISERLSNLQVAPRMREVDTEVWLAHGEVSDKARFDLARDFREHSGAGVFVSTIDAMQVGISLAGATSVHFAELHHSPAALLQAEDRPYALDSTGLGIVYYVVKGSVDEHIESQLLPKFKTQELMTGEEGATDARTTFAPEVEEDMDAIWMRLTAHLE